MQTSSGNPSDSDELAGFEGWLARSLYRSVEVGQPIPVDLYAAVAAILAYLYRQRVEAEMRERRARSAARPKASPADPRRSFR